MGQDTTERLFDITEDEPVGMPGGSLLGHEGRSEFARWLKLQQRRLGLSQTTIGKRLRGNPKQWRSYVKGEVFPRSDGCLAIARALGLPKLALLFKAGYLASLLSALPELVRLGKDHCEREGLSFVPPPVAGSVVPSGTERPGFLAYRTRTEYDLLVPFEVSDALYVAITAFPRRGDWFNAEEDNYEIELWQRIEEAFEEVDFVYAKSDRLPFPLDLASRILVDGRIPPKIRKAAAGELTQFWATNVSPYVAAQIKAHVYAIFADKLGAVSPISGHGMPLSALFERIVSGVPIIQSDK